VSGQSDYVTFDCYGTLIDWETGIRTTFLRAARQDGVHLDETCIIPTYAEVEHVVESGRYRRYRDVLAESAFADTNPALERLRAAGIRLGIVSNIDDDLIALTRRHFTTDFDLVITAQQVGSYKPSPMHFLTARDRLVDQPQGRPRIAGRNTDDGVSRSDGTG